MKGSGLASHGGPEREQHYYSIPISRFVATSYKSEICAKMYVDLPLSGVVGVAHTRLCKDHAICVHKNAHRDVYVRYSDHFLGELVD